MRHVLVSITILALAVSFFASVPVFASDSNGTIDDTYKYSRICKDASCVTYGTVNWKPTGATAVSITDSGLSGYMWGDEIGWINLDPTNAGVSIDADTGALSGYAYSSGGGWINFNPTDVGGGTDVGVTIDANGQFDGWAWVSGAYGGWMKFDCAVSATCVTTDWRPTAYRSSDADSGSGGGVSKKNNKYKKLLPTSPGESLIIGPKQVFVGDTVELVVITYDSLGNANDGDDTVTVSSNGSNFAYPTVTDAGYGIYMTSYVALEEGEDVITATVNGVSVGKDTDGASDGELHIKIKGKGKGKSDTPPGKGKKNDPPEPTPDPEPEPTPEPDPILLDYGLTESCTRAFAWDQEVAASIYRTIGSYDETLIATTNANSPWFNDIDEVTDSGIVYRFVFGDDSEQHVTFTTEEIASCVADLEPEPEPEPDPEPTPDPEPEPESTPTITPEVEPDPVAEPDPEPTPTTTPTTTPETEPEIIIGTDPEVEPEIDLDEPTTTPETEPTPDPEPEPVPDVVEEDVDGDGNDEQIIEGVYQDSDGSSAPVASVYDGVLIDTNDDTEPDTYWNPRTGTSSVISAGDRLFITDNSVTGVTMYEPFEQREYNVILMDLSNGHVALVLTSSNLKSFEEPLTIPPPPLPEPIQSAIVILGMLTGTILNLSSLTRIPISVSNFGKVLARAKYSVLVLFADRHRDQYWGTVYDSVTKAPINLAIVELLDENGQKVQGAITDLNGGYSFLVVPGTYTLRAAKANYAFPSETNEGNGDDASFHNFYSGQKFTIEQDQPIGINIPIDPVSVGFDQRNEVEKFRDTLGAYNPYIIRTFVLFFYGGLVLVAWQFLSSPSMLTGVLVCLYVVLLVAWLMREKLKGAFENTFHQAPSY